jgi:hypothetical protein
LDVGTPPVELDHALVEAVVDGLRRSSEGGGPPPADVIER